MKTLTLQCILSKKLAGDRINLASNILNIILDEYGVDRGGELPHPLVFNLRRGSSTLETYGRVMEFTAEEGFVEVSPFIAKSLHIEEGDNATVTLASTPELPKATFALLKPLTANYLQIPDIRSLLTSFLRKNYATLIEDSTLQVEFGRNQSVSFKIQKLVPESVCLCLDTDLEVDIQTDDLGLAESAIRLRNLSNDEEWKKRELEWVFEVASSLQGKIVIKIPLLKDKQIKEYKLKLSIESKGDLNLFVSDTAEVPALLDHLYHAVDKGNRVLVMEASAFSYQDRPFLYVSLEPYGDFSGEIKFRLQIAASAFQTSNVDIDATAQNDAALGSSADDKEKCSNCLLYVPRRTLQMHVAFCTRNNIVCNKCLKVFQRSVFPSHWHCNLCDKIGVLEESAKHVELYHTILSCSCGDKLFLPQVKQHKALECPDRYIICRYCHLLLKAGPSSKLAKDLYLDLKLSEHESECGARTIDCQKCGKSVQMKEVQLHMQTHELQKQQQPLPFQMCRNEICPNPQNSQFLNPLKLCQTCYAPFYSPRWDPTNQKVPQLVVQKYHQQLTIGCGSDFCSNSVSFPCPFFKASKRLLKHVI
jgi:hypothetical protein